MDLAEANKVEEHPTQPVQGTQAASLLVSMAMSRVWGGVPILALTIYVGLCMICLPEAIGTTDLLATRLDKNWSLVWSSVCIWRILSSHDSGFEGLNGEHGLYTWKTWRVEPWSGVSHLGFRQWTREMQRRASEKRRVLSAMALDFSCEVELGFDGLVWPRVCLFI